MCSGHYVLSHGVRRSRGTSPYEAAGDGGAAAPREAGASRLRLHPAAASPWRCCGCFSVLCPSVPVPACCSNSTLPAARVPGVPAGGPGGPGSGRGAGGASGHGEMGAVVGGWRLWWRAQPVWGQGKGLKESQSQGCEIQAVCEAGSPRPAKAWVGFPIGCACNKPSGRSLLNVRVFPLTYVFVSRAASPCFIMAYSAPAAWPGKGGGSAERVPQPQAPRATLGCPSTPHVPRVTGARRAPMQRPPCSTVEEAAFSI